METRVVRGEWDGKATYYAISRDISERLKTEQQLRRSEARWQIALESSGDGLWDWDAKTNKVFYSRQWKSMFGYQENEISDLRDEWEKRIHPDDIKMVSRDIEAHFSGKTPIFMSEHRMLCKNGNYKWILDRGKIISRDENGNPERVIGIHTDISSRKKIEDTLLKALQKEKELNELKSQFVSMASHEFRTPLAAMQMAADTLEAYRKRMSDQDVVNKIEKIKSNIRYLSNITEKTLNLSRLESGKLKFLPELTEINGFVREVADKLGKSFGIEHMVSFQGSNAPVNLKIDRQMIEQVLTNLLVNCFKYSKAGSRVDVNLFDMPVQVNIQVRDQGIGIPEYETGHIFEAFVRGTNVGNIHGTGLGLTISKRFIQMHGGEITVESDATKGTTFFISLPKNHFKTDNYH